MADPQVRVDKDMFMDPRVENEDGSFGALRPGYRDVDSHWIVFDGDEAPASAPLSLVEQPVIEEPEKATVEPEVAPQDLEDSGESSASEAFEAPSE